MSKATSWAANKTKRLRSAMQEGRAKLRAFQDNRAEALRQFVGFHYSDDGSLDKVPVNYLCMAIKTYTRALAARSPQVLVDTPYQQLRSTAADTALAVNHLLKEVKAEKVFRQLVVSGLFSMGFLKSARQSIGILDLEGNQVLRGRPSIKCIDLDDWVHDAFARDMDEAEFYGNRYRLPLEEAKNTHFFNKKMREILIPTDRVSSTGAGQNSAAQLGGKFNSDGEFYEHVELWDLYLPKDNLIITMTYDEQNDEDVPLRVQDWTGPDRGPYNWLGFQPVPQNAMSLAPTAQWMDLHDLANRVFRKIGRQAERQKDIGLASDEDDATRINEASDGQTVKCLDNKNYQQVSLGGINNSAFAFALQLQDMISWFAGNLDSLAGLSPQANTLGQEELISGASSKMVQDMTAQVTTCVEIAVRDLAWHLWDDPLIQLPLTKRHPNVPDVEVNFTFNQESKNGEFLDYNFTIEPFSMQHDSPASKIAALDKFIGVIGPMLPLMMPQGLSINFQELVRLYAKYLNIEGIERLLTFIEPNPELSPPVGQPPAKLMNTPTQNIRTNQNIGNPKGKRSAMISTLLGAGLQPKETAGMM